MGVDFKILAEYKKDEEWRLLKDDIEGVGELRKYEENYRQQFQTEYWTIKDNIGRVLRSMILWYDEVLDLSNDANMMWQYLGEIKKLDLSRISIKYTNEPEIATSIISDIVGAKVYCYDELSASDFRIIFIRY